MSRGSYLCGDIQFEGGEILLLTHCHGTNCRKLSGAAFCTAVHVIPEPFRSVKKTELLAQYGSAPGSFRTVCRTCGSSVPEQADYFPTISIPAGLCDDDPGVRPSLHTFVASQAPGWETSMAYGKLSISGLFRLANHRKFYSSHSPPYSNTRPDIAHPVIIMTVDTYRQLMDIAHAGRHH